MSSRVLVTGGAGFVGAGLVRRLVARGARVRVLDSLVAGTPAYLEGTGAELVVGDVRDRAAVAAALRGQDAAVHLAAAGSVVDSVADPDANFDVNVHGGLAVLQAARAAGVGRLVMASTGGALIGDAEPPVDERSAPRPLSPYGAGKAAVEAYAHAFARSYGLPVVTLRFANVYGPFSGHKRGAVTRFLRCLHDGTPLTVYGDGTSTRDFLHLEDITAAVDLALTRPLEPGTVLHVASGVETSINDLVDLCRQVAGRPDHPVVHEPGRAGEVGRNAASYDLAQVLLGYRPTVELGPGLASTWDWFGANVFPARAAAAG